MRILNHGHRYDDDEYMIFLSSELKLKMNLKLKLTNLKTVNFLYVTASMICEEFKADLYCKSNTCHKRL